MGDVVWFTRRAGEFVREVDVAVVDGEEGVLLMGDLRCPDWVQMPPELGGGQVRVEAVGRAPCICCEPPKLDRVHYRLANGYRVVECPGVGFSIYESAPEAPKDPISIVAVDGTITLVAAITFEECQRAVQGYVEVVYLPLRDLAVLVNEEGLLIGMEPNAYASKLTGREIVGPVVVLHGESVIDGVLNGVGVSLAEEEG